MFMPFVLTFRHAFYNYLFLDTLDRPMRNGTKIEKKREKNNWERSGQEKEGGKRKKREYEQMTTDTQNLIAFLNDASVISHLSFQDKRALHMALSTDERSPAANENRTKISNLVDVIWNMIPSYAPCKTKEFERELTQIKALALKEEAKREELLLSSSLWDLLVMVVNRRVHSVKGSRVSLSSAVAVPYWKQNIENVLSGRCKVERYLPVLYPLHVSRRALKRVHFEVAAENSHCEEPLREGKNSVILPEIPPIPPIAPFTLGKTQVEDTQEARNQKIPIPALPPLFAQPEDLLAPSVSAEDPVKTMEEITIIPSSPAVVDITTTSQTTTMTSSNVVADPLPTTLSTTDTSSSPAIVPTLPPATIVSSSVVDTTPTDTSSPALPVPLPPTATDKLPSSAAEPGRWCCIQ